MPQIAFGIRGRWTVDRVRLSLLLYIRPEYWTVFVRVLGYGLFSIYL